MLKLSFLPGELLAHILHYDDISHVVVALWKCGDVMLNMKMREWVSMVDLEDRNPVSKSRYPLMLSQLRELRRLRIYHQGHIAPPSILSVELRKLSSKLQELEISSIDGHLPFYEFPATLAPSESFASKDLDLSMWNIGVSFPHLVKLIANSTKEEPEHTAEIFELSPGLRPLLPPQLEYLELNTVSHRNLQSNEFDVAPCVPKSLRTLKLLRAPSTSSWPPHLTHLEGGRAHDGMTLPASLTRTPSLALPNASDLPSIVQRLTDLRHLTLTANEYMDIADVDWMPKTITVFDAVDCRLLVAALQALPSTLKRLTIFSIQWIAAPATTLGSGCAFLESLWPKSLEALDIVELSSGLRHRHSNSDELDGKKVIASLPQSLTDLRLNFEEFQVEWDLAHLAQLQALQLRGHCISFKPTNLINPNLKMLMVHIGTDPISSSNVPTHAINSTIFFKNLPPNLTKLEAWFIPFFYPPGAWSLLPRTLTSIELGTCYYVSDNGILYSDWPDDSDAGETSSEEDSDQGGAPSMLNPEDFLPSLPPNGTNLILPASHAPSKSLLESTPCLAKIRRQFSFCQRSLADLGSAALETLMEVWPPADLLYSHLYEQGLGRSSYLARTEVVNATHRVVEGTHSFPDPRTIAELLD